MALNNNGVLLQHLLICSSTRHTALATQNNVSEDLLVVSQRNVKSGSN